MTDTRLLSLLHFGDSAFPRAATRILWLETYCRRHGADREDLERFLLTPSSRAPPGLATRRRRRESSARPSMQDLGACHGIDQTLEANEAGAGVPRSEPPDGTPDLRVAAALTEDRRLVDYAGDVDESLAPGHHAVPYGLAAAALGWTPKRRPRLSLLVDSPSRGAALRLLSMGQLEGSGCSGACNPVIERWRGRPPPRREGDLELRARHRAGGHPACRART